jgi:hypothetical protein|tara:strand:+ start:3367 stop:3996 length:630 start_codon:yes stop_codon:yes gene_type:complete
MKYIMIPALCLLSGAAIANECEYSTGVTSSFDGVISKSKNYDNITYPHVDNTRKCVVNLDVEIKQKWYQTSGSFIFGPNMSENDACKNAETNAKENILRTTVPEILKKNTEQNCNLTIGEKIQPSKQSAPPAVPIKPVQMVQLPDEDYCFERPFDENCSIQSTQRNSSIGGFLNNIFQVDRPTQKICTKAYFNVSIDGVNQLAWKEICS